MSANEQQHVVNAAVNYELLVYNAYTARNTWTYKKYRYFKHRI